MCTQLCATLTVICRPPPLDRLEGAHTREHTCKKTHNTSALTRLEKAHLPSARLSAGGYSTRELIIVSSFHIFAKAQTLGVRQGTQLGWGFLRNRVYCSSRCVTNAAGRGPLKLKLQSVFLRVERADTGNKAKLYFSGDANKYWWLYCVYRCAALSHCGRQGLHSSQTHFGSRVPVFQIHHSLFHI